MGSDRPWYAPDKWNVSLYNWADEVRKQMPNLPKKVEIRDVSLREADDQMGLYLTVEDKVKLALKSSEAGAKELDIGGPNLMPHQAETCRGVRKAFDKAGIDKSVTRISGRYFGLSRDHKHEIDVIMAAGATDVRFVVMSPTISGVEKFEKQLAQIPEAVDYCHKKYGATMTMGMDDTSRTAIEFVEQAYKTIIAAGADKAWFSDTKGVAIPTAQRYLAEQIRGIIGPDMPLACHIHNMAGMATATTLAAIEGGVTEPDVTWNGYGDQAGNACLEEVVCDLEAYYGVQTGMKMEKLTEVAEMVERMCGMETQRHKAYSGKDAFAFMINTWGNPIGMMLTGVSKEEAEKMIAERKQVSEREPFNPAVLGRKNIYCWGSYGSRQERVMKAKLENMGLKYTEDDIKKIMDAVIVEVDKQVALNKELMAQKRPGYLTDEELDVLVRKIVRS